MQGMPCAEKREEMTYGEFVSVDDWRVWVEYDWLDASCLTLREKAKQIRKSGWLRERKLE